MVALVTKAAAALAAPPQPAITEILPGCWLIPLPLQHIAPPNAFTAAIAFTETFLNTPEFTTICDSAGLDVVQARLLIQPFLKPSQTDLRQLALVLQWTADDLARAHRDRQAIGQFADKLTQAYEETILLFRLAGLMNSTAHPAQLIQAICDQIHEILPFSWLAVRFSPDSREVPDLAGRLILAGDLPCPTNTLDHAIVPLFEHADSDNWTRLLQPNASPLAALAHSEVLAEPITHDQRTIGLLVSGGKHGPDPDICSAEMKFIKAAADFLGIFHENMARFAEQHLLFTGMLQAMSASIDAKDRYTCGHSERVGFLATQMAVALHLDKSQVQFYRIAGLLHDVGKIGVPEHVLCKAGRLNADEYAEVRRHPEVGHRILRGVPSIPLVLQGVLHHHERWDGTGYPAKLAGENIPLVARVLALADALDAMCSTRSYRPAMARDIALAEIRRCAGAQFDPALVPIFLSLDLTEFANMLEHSRVLTAFAA